MYIGFRACTYGDLCHYNQFSSLTFQNTGVRRYGRQADEVEIAGAVEKKRQIRALLKAIETGDPAAVAVVNEEKYIQHNPQTHEGSEGLAALFKRLSETSPRVNIVRAFSDGDYVFGHTEYDFATRRIGFEVFRFEGEQAVEHWDNIQARKGPNPSGRTMVDGPTEAADLDLTEANRETVRAFIDHVLINRRLEMLDRYIDDAPFIQHNPDLADGIPSLRAGAGGNIRWRREDPIRALPPRAGGREFCTCRQRRRSGRRPHVLL